MVSAIQVGSRTKKSDPFFSRPGGPLLLRSIPLNTIYPHFEDTMYIYKWPIYIYIYPIYISYIYPIYISLLYTIYPSLSIMCYSVDRPMTPQKCHWFLSGGTGGGEGVASTRGGALRVVFLPMKL